MLIESKNEAKKKAKRLNFHKGRQSRSPSQTNGDAKIQINVETAIPKLEKLAQKYIGISNPYGFLTDLRTALGIPNKQGASKYGEVTIPRNDGSVLQASLRITNHQANAGTYITHNANCEYNLSIVVRKTRRRNTFKPHDDVRLDEFVYYGKNIAQVENPLTQIVNSIIGFLQNGDYIDTTGVALPNTSPQTNNDNNNQNIKTENRNMNKKLIRLTETDLHRIVKKSVNKVLREGVYNGTGHYFGSNGDGLEHMYAPTKEELFADIREHNWDELQRFVSDHRHLDDDNSPLVEAIEKAIELHNEAYTMIERIGEKLAYGDLTYNEH